MKGKYLRFSTNPFALQYFNALKDKHVWINVEIPAENMFCKCIGITANREKFVVQLPDGTIEQRGYVYYVIPDPELCPYISVRDGLSGVVHLRTLGMLDKYNIDLRNNKTRDKLMHALRTDKSFILRLNPNNLPEGTELVEGL